MKPIIKLLKLYLDDRGYLAEILRSDDPEFIKFGQLYLSTITPGTIKAFHRHHYKTDYMTCVRGQVKVAVIEVDPVTNDLVQLYEYNLSPMVPQLLIIPPELWHGWMCIGSKEAILINVTTEVFDPNNNDEDRIDPIDNPWNYKWEIKHR